MLRELLIVGAGGFFGATSRHFIYSSNLLSKEDLLSRSATGSFCINLLGCLAVGFAFGYLSFGQAATSTSSVSSAHNLKLFLVTGFLGGFTTYSTFALDSFLFLKEERYFTFISYLSTQVILGVCLVAIGWKFSTYLRQ